MCPVRVRPLNAREKAGDAENAWKIKKNTICSIGGERDVNLHFGKVLLPCDTALLLWPLCCLAALTVRVHAISILADNLFNTKSTTQEVYDTMAKGVVTSAMEGIHGKTSVPPPFRRCNAAVLMPIWHRCDQALYSLTARPAAARPIQ